MHRRTPHAPSGHAPSGSHHSHGRAAYRRAPSIAVHHGALPQAPVPAQPAPAVENPGSGILAASYNVHKCVGADGRFRPDRVAAVLAEIGADLVALQEADRRFGRRTGLIDIAALKRETGLVPLPVSDIPDGLGWHGNAVLVREGSLTRVRRLTLPGAEPRGAVLAESRLPGGPIRAVAAHLGLLRRCRARQVAMILEAIAEGETMPTLLLGDLNEWRPRAEPLRRLEPVFGPARFSPASFPARLPVLALDRILGWPHGVVERVEVHDTPLARIASDHLPLKARINLSAGAQMLEEPLAAAA
ncbi:endonuclease/exonuclease/phosphatase family protein [Siccirubricoccus sp. G192]|nr:endonuclease/exonuclease/phosphatase family protein [Siccirubricoccus sp. G192]